MSKVFGTSKGLALGQTPGLVKGARPSWWEKAGPLERHIFECTGKRVVVPEDVEASLPVCAMCARPVERLDVVAYDRTTLTFLLRCHGQRQTVRLALAEIADGGRIVFGLAFATKGLARPKLEA